MPYAILPSLQETIDKLVEEFPLIPTERRKTLQPLTDYLASTAQGDEKIKLNFICTHNSRRSHIAQLWAQAAANYYGVDNIETYSGGTEGTAFNPRAVHAMIETGFDVSVVKPGVNPVYLARFSEAGPGLMLFSKKYDDAFNPSTGFAAVMTCSHADQNCPLVPGASARIAITYDDPKDFDGTQQEADKYRERALEIGREILYAFSKVNKQHRTQAIA